MTALTYDFYSPFASVSIITGRGQRIPLWVVDQEQASSATAEALIDRPFVQEVTVVLNLGGAPQLTVKLTPTYQQALEYLNSTLVEFGNNAKLTVLLGYSTGGRGGGPVFGPEFTAVLQKPEVQIGSDISVTLKASIAYTNFNLNSSTETLRGTKANIIRNLLRGPDPLNPTPVRADFTEVEALGVDNDTYKSFFDDVISEPMGGRTPWQVVSEYVWEALCWCVFDGDMLRVFPRSTAMNAAPKYLLAVYDFPGAIGPAEGVFPILGITTPTMIYGAGVLFQMGATFTDPRTRAPVVNIYTDSTHPVSRVEGGTGTPQSTPTAPGPGPNSARVPNGGQVLAGEHTDDNAGNQHRAALAEWQTAQAGIGMKIELQTLGIPDLIPGDVVTIVGAGLRVDGNYAVMKVTHTVGSGGATTALEAVKNVENALAQGRQTLGQVNRSRAQPSAGGRALLERAARPFRMLARVIEDLDVIAIPRDLRGI